MKLKDLLFKFSTHIAHNKYLYFDIEEFNPYGNLSIQIDATGKYPDVVVHNVFRLTDKPSDVISKSYIIKEDILDDILINIINYIFSDFIDDYKRVK